METSDIGDLVGTHTLSGVERGALPRENEWGETPNTLSFVLDGIAYTAVEDPDDGYRSALRELRVGGEVGNRFPDVPVIAALEGEVLSLRHAETGAEIVAVGTDTSDDYYPCFVSNFTPEAIPVRS